MKTFKIITLILIFCVIGLPSHAYDLDLERGLQEDLFKSLAIVEKSLEKMQEGSPLTNEISRLKSSAESITATHMLLTERFRARADRVAAVGSEAYERQNSMTGGYFQAVNEFLSIIEGSLQSETIFEETLNALRRLLKKILYRKKPLIFGALPYKTLNYPAQQPVEQSSITPAYKGGDKTVSTDDVEGTLEAPITEEIVALAESLEWNPVLIYEWVKNNVETEWYWGCMKGAEETLRQKSGNDSDQAALLIALLRASGFPSRYVRGVVEFFPGIETAKNLTGIQEPQGIASFFRKAGIPHKLVIEGGKIANFQIEHIWVESQIPFANFHGAVVDEHGKAWLGLDTCIKVKGYTYNQPMDILEEYPISNIRDEYLSTLRDLTPLEYIRTDIEAYLELNYPDLTYEDLLRTKSLTPEAMNILPASLQFKQVVITNEYTALPDELIHKVRFSASDPNNNDLFDITLETLRLSNQLIAVTYEPETVEDQAVINSYGGLDNTPAYLVRLRPTLELNNENVVVGAEGLPIGAEFNLNLSLISPNGEEKVTNTLITGNYAVMGIVSQQAVTPAVIPDEERDAYRILYEEAINYIDQWNQAEDELAALMQLSITRPIPTVVTLGGVMDVTYLLDTPHGFEWKGLYVDVDLRAVEATGISKDTVKDFMRLSGLQGSILENTVFEDAFQVESISTAKVFQLANDSQITIITVDKDNLDSVLPTLSFADAIKEDITNAVNQDLTVMIPQSEISYEDWTGIGYIKEDPQTGASGWMLSGVIAGGMTAEEANKWAQNWLNNPFAEPPNDDPSEAYYLFKISATDRQTGTVGQALPTPLQVIVFDRAGKPVKDVWVKFSNKFGGGKLKGQVLESPTELSAQTNNTGIASVSLILGEQTGDNPVYLYEKGKTYSEQMGLNIVDAELESGLNAGTRIRTYFSAYGKPKEPREIFPLYGNFATAPILSYSGFVSVMVVDEYYNPVSNQTVKFEAQTVSDGCGQDPRTNALLFEFDNTNPCTQKWPVWGECGITGKSIEIETSKTGATAGVLLGGVPGASYPIKVTSGNLTEQTFFHYSISESCTTDSAALHVIGILPADAYGNVINASKLNTPISVLARFFGIIGSNGSFSVITNLTDPKVTFGGKDADEIHPSGHAIGKYLVTEPVNNIPVEASAIVGTQNCTASSNITVYGVEIKDLAITDTQTNQPLSFVLVDRDGITVHDLDISYEITPAAYTALSAYVVILENGKPKHYVRSSQKGQSTQTLLKDKWFDVNIFNYYEAQVILNIGTDMEIKSDPIPINIRVADLEFIRQDNTLFPMTGDDACHMVSKFVTDINLPNIATFDGPPGPSASIDPDTFRLQVKGLPAGQSPKIKLKVLHKAEKTYEHEFDMVQGMLDSVPVYRTNEHIRLVSNAVDDAYLAHQTVLVQLEDIVSATLILDGKVVTSTELPVGRPSSENGPKAFRTVDINFVTLQGTNSNPQLTVDRMSEDWAQVAIRFNLLSSSTVTPVTNVLAIAGTANNSGQLTVDIAPQGAQPIRVTAQIANDDTDEKMAQKLSAAIDANKDLSADYYRSLMTPNPEVYAYLIIVNKGKEINFNNIQSTVGTNILADATDELNFSDNISTLEGNILGLNFKDNDPKSIDMIAVGKILVAGGRAYTGRDGTASVAEGFDNTTIIREEAVDTNDSGFPFTAGHEVGHALFDVDDTGHLNVLTNLFRGGTSTLDSISASKRLTSDQNNLARQESGSSTDPPLLQKK